MARRIIVNNEKDKTEPQSKENKVVRKSSRRFSKAKVNSNGKVVSETNESEAPQKEPERLEKDNNEDNKYVLVRKKQRYEEHPELYESDSAPIMTFNKEEQKDNTSKDVVDDVYGWEATPYEPKEQQPRDIDPRTPEEKFQEYKSSKLEYGSNDILYDGKVYTIKNEYFSHFIKEAQNSLYSNIGSRNWARKVAEKELKENNVDIKDIRDIVLPVDLMINGKKIELPDIDGNEPEAPTSSIPGMDF